MQKTLKRIYPATLLICLTASFVVLANAAEKKVDPTGTWQWTFSMGSTTYTQTMNLKFEGDKLTGTILSDRDTSRTNVIEQVVLVGDEISFQVSRERNGQRTVAKYKGKIEDDTLKGKINSNFGNRVQTRDWEAKRIPAEGSGPKSK